MFKDQTQEFPFGCTKNKIHGIEIPTNLLKLNKL